MNLEKRKCYCDNKTSIGIHTGNGVTDDAVDLYQATQSPFMVNCNIRKVRNEDRYEIYMRINPNRNQNGYIADSYSEFQEVVNGLFDELGVNDFKWRRIDLSFNTMDSRYYEDYTKLNRLLIACFADSMNDRNTYDTKDFWNGKTKSLATKNGYYEIEFYDKRKESNAGSPYHSRLELRSKRIQGSIEDEFLEKWFARMDQAVEHFEHVQERFNRNMAEIYLADQTKKKKDRSFLNITSFLMAKKDYIFTSTQMKELLMLLDLTEEKAQNAAYNFKKRHTIEYYKKDDLIAIVADIKSKIIEYFSK